MSRSPIWHVSVRASADAEPIDVSDKIISITYDDEESKPDKLVLQVDNYDTTAYDSPLWKTGNTVEVTWGYPGNMSPIRTGKIQKISGGAVLAVECKDLSVLMAKVQRVRTFEAKKRSDVARQIAEEWGYLPDEIHIDDTEEVLEQVTQARMSDAQLLRDMAKREGFEFYVDFDGFHWHRRKLDQPAVRTYVWHNGPTGDLQNWGVKDDPSAQKAGAITVAAIDPKTKENIEHTATNDTAKDKPVLAPVKELFIPVGKGKVGAAYLRDVPAAQPPIKQREADQASSVVARTTEPTQASAVRQAQGAYAKNQLAAVILSLETAGDPQALAKSVVTVLGIGETLSGNYYRTKIQHKLGAGYTMTEEARRDGKSAATTLASLVDQVPTASGGGVPARGPVNASQGPLLPPGMGVLRPPEPAPVQEVFIPVGKGKVGAAVYREAPRQPPPPPPTTAPAGEFIFGVTIPQPAAAVGPLAPVYAPPSSSSADADGDGLPDNLGLGQSTFP